MTFLAVELTEERCEARPWKRATLGEVCRTTSGGTPSRKRPDFFVGTIPWVKSGELPDGLVSEVKEFITDEALANSSAKVFPAGTLLIALYGATVGKLGVLTRAAATNQAVCAIFTPPELETKFLFWYLKHRRADLIAQAVGGAQPNISQSILRTMELRVPPVEDQRRIVAYIEKQVSRLDEAVANLKRVKANLKRYRAAVLKAAVEGRLVPTEAELARREGRSYETGAQLLQRILEERRQHWTGKGRYKEPYPPNIATLPQIPEGWFWSSVSQIADVASGNTPSGVLTAVLPSGELPWFKVGDMNHVDNLQVMRHAEAWLKETEAKNLGLRVFAPPTIFFPKRGGAIATNKKRQLASRACADLNVMGITPAHAVAAFFFTWFDGIDLAKLSDGSNVPQINHKDIDPLAMPLPPLAEQHRIVAQVDRFLSVVREVEAEVEGNLFRADRLRYIVLMAAFIETGTGGDSSEGQPASKEPLHVSA